MKFSKKIEEGIKEYEADLKRRKEGKFTKLSDVKKEINDCKWVTPEEMMGYDITEADLPFVKKLIEGI